MSDRKRKLIIALVGPTKAGKSELILDMIEIFTDQLGILKSVTTRPQREHDRYDRLGYECISRQGFDELREQGVLIQGGTRMYGREFYDNVRTETEALLAERIGICAWVEPAIRAFRALGYEVFYVKIVPTGAWKPSDSTRTDEDRKREAEASDLTPDLVIENCIEANENGVPTPGDGFLAAASELKRFIEPFIERPGLH